MKKRNKPAYSCQNLPKHLTNTRMTKCLYHKPPQDGLPAQTNSSGKTRRLTLFIALMVSLFTISETVAQDQTVTGTITSSQNEPLPGVSVLVKGTSLGTSSDADGKFRLVVPNPQNSVLVFSFIGFATQELTVGARTDFSVVMSEDITQLNEVVVTALGISQEKRSLGYSVQEVKGTDIAGTQRPNFMVSLQGRVAGLNMISTSGLPGSSTSITLRGIGSISGNNQPLIVVDGLPVDNRVLDQHNLVSNGDNRNADYINRAADINPNDIESITVLKGPEAAALYGQGGASGAIIITTRKGSSGSVKINYDNNFGFQKLYRFPKVQTVYGRGDFGYDNPAVEEISYFGAPYAEGVQKYDNVGSFFKTGSSQTHNISIEGGTDQLTNRLSVNYFTQDGVVPNNKYDKFSARLTSSSKFANKIDITTTINYINTTNKKPSRGVNGFLFGVLAWPVIDDMANYLNPDGSRRRLIPDLASPATTYLEPNNPFFSVNKNLNVDKTNRVLGNMAVSYDPAKWLNVTGRIGADIYNTQGNTFSHPEGIGQVVVVAGSPNFLEQRGTIENFTENSKLLNGQLLATVRKEFGKFKASLLVGSSFDDKLYETNAVLGTSLLIKDFNSLNNTTANKGFKQTIVRQRSVSAFSSFTLNYGDLVYLNVTGRNDWSSTMPLANNSYFYPSASMSFVFTELEALQDLGVLSFGKLRASYAEVGKDAPPYKVKSSLINRNYTGGGFNYDFYGGNPNLKPERAEGYEVGTELKFFNGRIGLDVAAYKNDRIDQISVQRLSYGTGFIFGLLNGGHMSVRGVEVQLTGTPVLKTDFEWNVTVNYSKSKSIVIELPAGVREYYNSDTWLYGNARGSMFPENMQTFFSEASFPYYNWDYLQRGLGSATAIGGVTYQRNQNGDILINPANGLPVKTPPLGDALPIGDRNPDFMLGITNSFRYKNINLSFLLDIRKGGDIFNANEMALTVMGLSTRTVNREQPMVFQGVLQDGLENSANPTVNTIEVNPYTMGSSFYGAFAESDYVEKDINWLRLRDVTLAFTFPSQMLAKAAPLRSASVFVTCTDLFLLTNYTGADPMVNGTTPATGGAGAFGFDYGSLSLPRSVTFGLRLGL
jgi:TonB-linked SusC/RagA family outer membrane protein